MTTGTVPVDQPDARAADSGYDAVRADDTIQFAPVEKPEQAEPPSWLKDFMEWLGELFTPLGQFFGSSWPMIKWVLIAAGVALLLLLLWNLLKPVLDLRSKPAPEDEEWVPEQSEAIALLEEADRLAANGAFDEATHLLLKRSVGQISAVRPDWVEPSSTARELANLSALPESARTAFATIAERVERSLFALRKLGPDDWQVARDAYAQFALQRLNGGGL